MKDPFDYIALALGAFAILALVTFVLANIFS